MGWSFLENGMLRTFHPVVNEAKCTGCKTCARVCPMSNISLCSVSPQDGLYSVFCKYYAKLQFAFEEPALRDGCANSETQRVILQSGSTATVRIFDGSVNHRTYRV